MYQRVTLGTHANPNHILGHHLQHTHPLSLVQIHQPSPHGPQHFAMSCVLLAKVKKLNYGSVE